MDQIDEISKERIAALWRAMCATKCIKEDNVPCQIEEGLFLGSIGAANNKSALRSLNVTHILTVANSLAPAHPNDFIYKIIDVRDREDINIAQYFDECFDYIDEAKRMGGGVLVHCFAGRSRSVTIVIAYLMKKHGMSMSRALEHVKSRRPLAAPNSGFDLQLQNFEKSLQGIFGELAAVSEDTAQLSREIFSRPGDDLQIFKDIEAPADVLETNTASPNFTGDASPVQDRTAPCLPATGDMSQPPSATIPPSPVIASVPTTEVLSASIEVPSSGAGDPSTVHNPQLATMDSESVFSEGLRSDIEVFLNPDDNLNPNDPVEWRSFSCSFRSVGMLNRIYRHYPKTFTNFAFQDPIFQRLFLDALVEFLVSLDGQPLTSVDLATIAGFQRRINDWKAVGLELSWLESRLQDVVYGHEIQSLIEKQALLKANLEKHEVEAAAMRHHVAFLEDRIAKNKARVADIVGALSQKMSSYIVNPSDMFFKDLL